MHIGLAEAAAICGKTPDELMFLQQTNRIQAGVDQETLVWQFVLSEVLELKAELEEEEARLLEKAELTED